MSGVRTLSVVVATCNRGRLLLNLLADLERQDLLGTAMNDDPFDVIVVDDGSREPARKLLEGRSFSFPIRVIEQENAGAAIARDRGIRAATGDVVVIIDDDMEVPAGFLRAHRCHHRFGATVVLGYIRPPAEIANMPLFERFHAWQLERQVSGALRGKPLRGAALCTGNVSFRRADYIAIGGFDPALEQSEDRDLGIRFELAGARLAFAADAYALHHSDHTSFDKWKRRAFRYGMFDMRISRKYPGLTYVEPWHLLTLTNPLSRPLLLLASAAPRLGELLSKAAWAISEAFDNRGLEAIALRGTTFVYGLEYFRGVRKESGSLRGAVNGVMAYLRRARQEH